MSERWITDASPLITLAKVGEAHLLTELCEELLVPDARLRTAMVLFSSTGFHSPAADRTMDRAYSHPTSKAGLMQVVGLSPEVFHVK